MQLDPAKIETKHVQRLNRAKEWYEIRECVSMRQWDELEGLCREIHSENVPHLPFDWEFLRKNAEPHLADIERRAYNCWVAYREGVPVGFCVGFINPFYFSPELASQTQILFVKKKYRGTPVAFLLIKEFVRWGSIRGVVRHLIDTSMQKNYKLFARMAEKLGFVPAGGYFVKDHYNV